MPFERHVLLVAMRLMKLISRRETTHKGFLCRVLERLVDLVFLVFGQVTTFDVVVVELFPCLDVLVVHETSATTSL